MTQHLSAYLLAQLSTLINTQVGLHFPQERWQDLERGIKSATQEFGFKGIEAGAEWLLSSPLDQSQIEILAGHLTIGETYFFREQPSLDALERHILKNFLQTRRHNHRRLRIWSAGCCTGEEPYTLAIILHQLIPDLKDWNILILATDINPNFLKKATRGIYREWSLRRTPASIKKKYFKQLSKNRYEISSEIKQMVTFSYLNLIEDSYPSPLNHTTMLDIIFCRNVLMYFSSTTIKAVAHRFYRCLIEGGWLIVSLTETSPQLYSPFSAVNFSSAVCYRKQNPFTPTSPPPLSEPFLPQLPADETPPTISTPQPDIQLPAAPAPANAPTGIVLPHSADSLPPPARKAKSTAYEKAAALYEQGQYEAVARELENLFAPDQHSNPRALPPEEKAILILIRAYANQGQLTEARKWGQKAVAADKLNPMYHYLLGTILQEQGEIEPAIKSLKRALFLQHDLILAHFAMGNLTLQQGKFTESNKHFDNALSLLKNHHPEDIVRESEGLTAGRLTEIIRLLKESNGDK